jgi:glycosyltransferase involved in cell wall biosynthesis
VIQGRNANCTARPAVSVVIATRNRPKLLKRAIASVAKQTLADYEVIVIDDGSDQEVRDTYTEFWPTTDSRFRLIFARPAGTRGTGPSAARNRGIQVAQADFVAFLDDDDEWILPDYLEVGVESLRRANADFFFSDMCGVRKGSIVQASVYCEESALRSGRRVNESPAVFEVPYRSLVSVMRRKATHPDNSIVRRHLLQEIGGFVERFSIAEDANLMLRLVDRAHRVVYRPEVAVAYLFSESNSVSHDFSRLEFYLQDIAAQQHARVHCRRKEVRRCARARESWALRSLSSHLMQVGRHAEALSFAWQAMAVFCSPGTVSFFTKSLIPVLGKRSAGESLARAAKSPKRPSSS